MNTVITQFKKLLKNDSTHHLLALGVCIFWSFILLRQLFIPELKIVSTPEFTQSDAISLSYASKYWYGQQIKQGILPIWSKEMGMGFPVLGEGQTGIFFAPNIFLFSILPISLAYNISLLLVFIFTGWGMYAWLYSLKFPKSLSLLGGLTALSSGYLFFHLQHIALLQAFSLTPALFAVSEVILQKRGKTYGILFSLLLCQQIFAGFPQAVFITLLTILLKILCIKNLFGNIRQTVFPFVIFTALGFLLSAMQLLPTLEFNSQITDAKGLPLTMSTVFSSQPILLATFLDPYILGNPKKGTYYTNPQIKNTTLFWENIGYIGIVPVIFFAVSLFFKKFRKNSIHLYCILFVMLLLMLGKNSPIYLIYSFFPFNLFRVPSRFIIPFTLYLVTLSMSFILYICAKSKKSMYAAYLILLCNLILIVFRYGNYHMLQTEREVMNKPQVIKTIQPTDIVFPFRTFSQQIQTFITHGWQDRSLYYKNMKNSLFPNTNILWNVPSYFAYPSRTLRRYSYYQQMMQLPQTLDDLENDFSEQTKKFISLASVRYIITSKKLPLSSLLLTQTVKTADTNQFYLYVKDNPLPFAYIVHSSVFIDTLSKAIQHANVIEPGKNVFVESKNIVINQKNVSVYDSVQTITNHDLLKQFLVNTNQRGIFVMNSMYYPGWKAYVDNTVVPIYPINIRFSGIELPKGNHLITFVYEPSSLQVGIIITSASLALIFVSTFLRKKSIQRIFRFFNIK